METSSRLDTTRRLSFQVLLVEDNPGDARLVEILLSEAESYLFEVTHVGRLDEAIEHVTRDEYDVVLLDLSLPDASGLDAVERMRAEAGHMPVVVLSGRTDGEVAVQALHGGAEDYLVKGQGDGELISRSIRYAIERKRAEEHLAFLSQYDALTGLANRALFGDRLAQACARSDRTGKPLALLFLDLDRFKAFNDALGHAFGDSLLKSVAERLSGCVREGDTVARMGSDEFAVIVEDVPGAEAVASPSQKIMDELSRPFVHYGQEVFVTTSMGIVVREPHHKGDIIKDAVTAMQRAKDSDPNSYQFFTPEMNARAFQRLAFESGLRRALMRDEFVIEYQPQVDLETGRIFGAEALLRWMHPDLGVVSPTEFVPVLEETGMVIPVGEWVLRRACEQARAWSDEGLPPVRIAINLSARQFKQPNLTDTVSRVLRSTGLDPSSLELELTEGILMEDTAQSGKKLQRLKQDEGLRVTIDDFGTGYSSLAYLKRFPLDVLKIDKSFVGDLARDPDDAAIVSTIINLAHNLRLKVIAEGVETGPQLQFLRDGGCDAIQGFFFSPPLPADDFAELLATGRRLFDA
jgi:diguanylate cyclase (GGDEF)-like protein